MGINMDIHNITKKIAETGETVLGLRTAPEKVLACVQDVFSVLQEVPTSPALKNKIVVVLGISSDLASAVGILSFANDIVDLCKGEWWAGKGSFDALTMQNIVDRSLCFIEHASLCGLHGFKTVSLVAVKLSVGTALMPIAVQVGAVAIPVFCVMLFARGVYQRYAYDESNGNRPTLTQLAGTSLLAISALCGVAYEKVLPNIKELEIASLAFCAAFSVVDLSDYVWERISA